MSTKLRSLLALLLALGMLIPLAACSSGDSGASGDTSDNGESAESADTTVGETEPVRLYPDLPDTDWEGAEFHVMGRTNETRWQFVSFEIWVESENGETVNDAVYQRNRAIEEKYNAKVTQNLVDNPQTELTKVVTAGDDVYDATLLVQTTVTTAAQNGEVLDLYELEYIDFDKPWWSQEVNNRVSIHNKLYFTTSDFKLMDKQRTSILFFNRDMAVDFDLGNPFDYVRDGSWTIDMMTEHAKKVSADLDGDGDIDQHDRHGSACIQQLSLLRLWLLLHQHDDQGHRKVCDAGSAEADRLPADERCGQAGILQQREADLDGGSGR